MSSGKWRPFCLGLNVLKWISTIHVSACAYGHSVPDDRGTPFWSCLIMQMVALFRFSTWDLWPGRWDRDSQERSQCIKQQWRSGYVYFKSPAVNRKSGSGGYSMLSGRQVKLNPSTAVQYQMDSIQDHTILQFWPLAKKINLASDNVGLCFQRNFCIALIQLFYI